MNVLAAAGILIAGIFAGLVLALLLGLFFALTTHPDFLAGKFPPNAS